MPTTPPPGVSDSEPTRTWAPPWVRSVLGDQLATRREVGSLPGFAHLSMMWWSLGLTPTARRRGRLFKESIQDGRGLSFALRKARGYAAI